MVNLNEKELLFWENYKKINISEIAMEIDHLKSLRMFYSMYKSIFTNITEGQLFCRRERNFFEQKILSYEDMHDDGLFRYPERILVFSGRISGRCLNFRGGGVLRKDVINHTGLERDPRERGLSSKGLVRPLKLTLMLLLSNMVSMT